VTVLILADTGLLLLLAILIVGLLRGHAELLRRTGGVQPASTAQPTAGQPGIASIPDPRTEETPAWDVAGRTLQGGAMKLAMKSDRNTLLAFLSSGCMSCQPFWEHLDEVSTQTLPGNARLMVVVKDPNYESPSKLEPFLSSDVPALMSSQAWSDYKVEIAPYFIYVDGGLGEVMSEGAASSWPQVFSLLRDAIADGEMASRWGG